MTAAKALTRRPPDRKVLEDAVAAFAAATGLRADLGRLEVPIGNRRADAIVEVGPAAHPTAYIAEVKTVDRATTLAQVQEQLAAFDRPGLLVTPYLTAELANQCRRIGLNFIDTAGNAYVNAPKLYVFIKGEKRPEQLPAMGARGGGTAAALRVVFALLHRHDLLNAPYREIVKAAGVALGTVGWVFFDLQERGYVINKQHDRRLVEPHRLFDEWVTNYPLKLRPKLTPRRFRAAAADWWINAALPDGVYWGGEVAADRLTHHLKPAKITLYIDPVQRGERTTQLVTTHRLRADPRGDIELLDTFWNFEHEQRDHQLVPPMLVYADLLATLDPRNLEVAKLVREQYVDRALRSI